MPVRKRTTFLLLALLAGSARAEDGGLSREERAALAEMDAKIAKLKAEGKLPDHVGDEKPPPKMGPPPPVNGCVRLRKGEAAVVRFPGDSGPTRIPMEYGLSRPADDTYLVELNVKYEAPPPPPDAPPGTPDAGAEMRDRVVACLKEFEGKLKDERGGKNMILRLTDNPAVPQQTVKVVGRGNRPNAGAYPVGLECSGILHETMHLLGLVDEYHDTPNLHDPLMDCRPAAPRDSIMSNDREAEAATKTQTAWAVEMCKCPVKGSACWKLAEKNNGKKCPEGTTSFLQNFDPRIKTSLNALNSDEAFVLDERRQPNGVAPPGRDSVLYPAHFRAITEPGCADVNSTYYSCVANAYRSSTSATFADPEGKGCLPKPTACQWGSFQWLQ